MRRGFLVVAILGLGCAPTAKVQVEAPQPIVIQLDIKHEVRLRIENDLGELVEGEAARAAVTSRSGELGDEARVRDALASGAAKESADGYVSLVDDDPALAAAIERINEGRQASYRGIAERHDVDRAAVEALAASLRTR